MTRKSYEIFINHSHFAVEMPPRVLSILIIKLAEIEQALAGGASENPQISAMISAFQIAKDSISV